MWQYVAMCDNALSACSLNDTIRYSVNVVRGTLAGEKRTRCMQTYVADDIRSGVSVVAAREPKACSCRASQETCTTYVQYEVQYGIIL